MTTATALDWLSQLLWTAVTVGAPPVLVIVIVGLVVSIVQAATQVNDSAVGFAPKVAAMMVTLVVIGEWMLIQLRDFTLTVFDAMAHVTQAVGS